MTDIGGNLMTVEAVAERGYRDDLKLFIGKNTEPYLALFDRQHEKRRGISFCWPAFFVPVAWFMYRRMHLYIAIFLAVVVVVVTLVPFTGSGGAGGFAAGFAMAGKPLYLAFARRKINKINKRATDEAQRLRLIEKAGGTSVVGAVVGSLITALPLVALFLPND